MTPADLAAWQAHMGYTQQQAAGALGVDRVSFARMLAGTAPINMRTGLACAALAAGLEPWAAADRGPIRGAGNGIGSVDR